MTQPGQSNMGSWGGGSPAGDAAGQQNNPVGSLRGTAPDLALINIAGVPLVNGTPTLASITTPADGIAHMYQVNFMTLTTTASTGGGCTVNFTFQGQAVSQLLLGGSFSVGGQSQLSAFSADPGTVISFTQSSALTAGAAKFSGTLELII